MTPTDFRVLLYVLSFAAVVVGTYGLAGPWASLLAAGLFAFCSLIR